MVPMFLRLFHLLQCLLHLPLYQFQRSRSNPRPKKSSRGRIKARKGREADTHSTEGLPPRSNTIRILRIGQASYHPKGLITTPLNIPRAQVLMQVREQLPEARKMRMVPEWCNLHKYCFYHRDLSHDIEECMQLQDEVEELIHCSQLDRFLQDQHKKCIAPEAPCAYQSHPQGWRSPLIALLRAIPIQSWAPMQGDGPNERQRVEEADEAITFTEIDAEGVQYPHNDPKVVALNIANYDVNGCSLTMEVPWMFSFMKHF